MLNQVPLQTFFEKELDSFHIEELHSLRKRLGLEFAEYVRMCPSIILRSELEFASCSNPRFAFRVYFQNSSSFVNVRRLREFSERMHIFDQVPDEVDSYTELSRDNVKKLVNTIQQSCIADCLLVCPPEFDRSVYHITEVELSRAFGESDPTINFQDFKAVPFVKNISLAGGLCAQACCFMATALLHDHASGIHGLAEITALANSPRRVRLNIVGLDGRQMNQYLQSVGLALTKQSARESNDTKRIAEFEAGLRSYVMSNIPVIVLADFGRLLGYRSREARSKPNPEKSIYNINGLAISPETPAKFDPTLGVRHAFVIVGCERRFDVGECQFIFNDPNAHPFMVASTKEIADAGPYVYSNSDSGKDIVSCQFCPVTPAAVKLPLLDYQSVATCNESDAFCLGLRTLSYRYREAVRSGTNFGRAPLSNAFRLVQIGRISEGVDPAAFTNRKQGFKDRLDVLTDGLVTLSADLKDRYGWSDKHWVWLEFLREPMPNADEDEDEIWVWDAEIAASERHLDECFIAKVTKYERQAWTQFPLDYDLGR